MVSLHCQIGNRTAVTQVRHPTPLLVEGRPNRARQSFANAFDCDLMSKKTWTGQSYFSNHALVKTFLRPHNAFKSSVFGAWRLVSTQTLLLKHYYRHNGKLTNNNCFIRKWAPWSGLEQTETPSGTRGKKAPCCKTHHVTTGNHLNGHGKLKCAVFPHWMRRWDAVWLHLGETTSGHTPKGWGRVSAFWVPSGSPLLRTPL